MTTTPTQHPARRGNRRTRLILAAIAAAAIYTVTPTQASAAIGGDCKEPPRSMAPYETFQGWIDPASASRPDRLDGSDPGVGFFDTPVAPPPTSGKPKDIAGPAENTLSNYGWAGFRWPMYDLKSGRQPACLISNAMDPVGNSVAQLGLSLLVSANATATSLSRYVHDPANYDKSNGLFSALGASSGRAALPLFMIGGLFVGVAILWRSERLDPRETGSRITTVLLLALSIASIIGWQTTLAGYFDRSLLGVVSYINGEAPGGTAAHGESARDLIVMQTWQAGMVGRTSPLQEQYGQSLYFAGVISNAEAAAAQYDPKIMGEKREEDAEKFRDLADEIKDKDEAAYDVLAGREPSARLGAVTLGWLTWIWSSGFQPLADLILAYTLTAVRFGLAIWPYIAVAALFRHEVLSWLLNRVLGATISCVGMAVLVWGSRLAQGALLSSQNQSNFLITTLWGFLIFLVCVAGSVPLLAMVFGVPKKWRDKALDALRRSRPDSDHPDHADGYRYDDPDFPTAPTGPQPVRVTVVPEATPDSPATIVGKATLSGAFTGALGGVVTAVATGGAAWPAVVAGATRGAVVAGTAAGVAEVSGSAAAGTAAGIAVANRLQGVQAPQTVDGLPAAPSPVQPDPGQATVTVIGVTSSSEQTALVMPGVADTTAAAETRTGTPVVVSVDPAQALDGRPATYDTAAAEAAQPAGHPAIALPGRVNARTALPAAPSAAGEPETVVVYEPGPDGVHRASTATVERTTVQGTDIADAVRRTYGADATTSAAGDGSYFIHQDGRTVGRITPRED